MSNVVFVFPSAHGNLGAFKNHLGVAYLRAALAREGITTTQYRQDNPGTVHNVADEILTHRPNIVGFTVYDANFSLSLALARRLKQKQPDLSVVFGGPTATFGAATILEKHDVVDACVLGEAEETGPPIFRQLLDRGHLDQSHPGLALRCDRAVSCSALPPLVGSTHPGKPADSALDAVPSPYLSGILTDGRTGVLTARGCTHHCQYCVFAALARKTLRLHSIDRVLAELDFIERHQTRTNEYYPVFVHDDAFTLLPERAKALCHAIAERNLSLELSCITRADRIDDELLRLMRKAGFVSLAFGLESAVPSVLRATGKVRPPDWPDADLEPERVFLAQVRASVVAARKYGFSVGLSIILGLPSETPADGEATLRFVKDLPLDNYAHNFLWTFPGTPLWDTHDRYDIRCATTSSGLSTTTDYAYDVASLRPRPKCLLEQDARMIRLLTADALYACHTASASRHGIATAVANAAELHADLASWLGRILDIGGLVVQIYPLHCQRETEDDLSRDRCVIADGEVPVRYHSQLLPRSVPPGRERWLVACLGVDLYRTHKPSLLSLESVDGPAPLLDWLNGKATEGVLCDLSEYLRRPDELRGFLGDSTVKDFGHMLRSMPFPPGLKYPGRWLRGRAPCRRLTRIEIDDHGFVRTCRHGKPIGRVGESKRALIRRLNRFAEEAERRRGCATCPNRHCPRCPFPGIDDEVYCRLMTEQTQSLRFLNWAQLYSRLPSVFAVQRDRLGSD